METFDYKSRVGLDQSTPSHITISPLLFLYMLSNKEKSPKQRIQRRLEYRAADSAAGVS